MTNITIENEYTAIVGFDATPYTVRDIDVDGKKIRGLAGVTYGCHSDSDAVNLYFYNPRDCTHLVLKVVKRNAITDELVRFSWVE